jgi:hypothetical protein
MRREVVLWKVNIVSNFWRKKAHFDFIHTINSSFSTEIKSIVVLVSLDGEDETKGFIWFN